MSPEALQGWLNLGVGGLMLGALLLGFKRIWVWGYQLAQAEKDRDEWKAMALDLLRTTRGVVEVASQNATMTPETAVDVLRELGIKSAEDARRIVREAGRERRDDGSQR